MSNVDLDLLSAAEMETMERVSAVLGCQSKDLENRIASLADKHLAGLAAGGASDDDRREIARTIMCGGQAVTA